MAPETSDSWARGKRSLDQYTVAMKHVSLADCGHVCAEFGPYLAHATQQLPRKAHTGPAVDSEGRDPLPECLPSDGAAVLMQKLLRNIEPGMRCEGYLAPEPLCGTARHGASLVDAEAWAVELADQLMLTSDWCAAQDAQWAVAESCERFTSFLRHLCGVVQTAQLGASLNAAAPHAEFLENMAKLIIESSTYMQAVLSSDDPVLNSCIRSGVAAQGLSEAATSLKERALAAPPSAIGTHKHRAGLVPSRSILCLVSEQLAKESPYWDDAAKSVKSSWRQEQALLDAEKLRPLVYRNRPPTSPGQESFGSSLARAEQALTTTDGFINKEMTAGTIGASTYPEPQEKDPAPWFGTNFTEQDDVMQLLQGFDSPR